MKNDSILDKALSKELNDFSTSNPLFSANNEELKMYVETEDLSPDRIGRFTGSSNSKLMSCKSRAQGKSWDQVKWIIDFGDTALRYIVEKAAERITGGQVETIDNKYTRWGKYYEAEGKVFFTEKYGIEINEVGFKQFLKNAGATPDGVLTHGEINICEGMSVVFKQEKPCVFELKCPETVFSHYKLGLYGIDESHDYFWQLISEMLSVKTDRFLFVSYDPRFPDEMKIKLHYGLISPIHVAALKARLIIAERLIVKVVESNFLCDIWKELPEAISDIPTDYEDFLNWLTEAEKPLLI